MYTCVCVCVCERERERERGEGERKRERGEGGRERWGRGERERGVAVGRNAGFIRLGALSQAIAADTKGATSSLCSALLLLCFSVTNTDSCDAGILYEGQIVSVASSPCPVTTDLNEVGYY